MKTPRTLKDFKNDPRVEFVSVEQNNYPKNDYWIYLNFPYISSNMETTSIHEESIKDTVEEFKGISINYAFYIADYSRPKKPEEKIIKNGQLEIPFEEMEYEEKLRDYEFKINQLWNDCMEHCIKHNQRDFQLLWQIKANYKNIPDYVPNWRASEYKTESQRLDLI